MRCITLSLKFTDVIKFAFTYQIVTIMVEHNFEKIV